jgi:hypothetical protein
MSALTAVPLRQLPVAAVAVAKQQSGSAMGAELISFLAAVLLCQLPLSVAVVL